MMTPRRRRPILLALAVAMLIVAVPAGTASGNARLTYRSSFTRLGGNRLMYRTWASGYFESLLIELRRPGYKINSSVLVREDGQWTHASPATSPCYPAPPGYLGRHGAVECPSLLYESNGHTGVRSVTIIFTTNRCYPRNAGLVGGVSGPTTPCGATPAAAGGRSAATRG